MFLVLVLRKRLSVHFLFKLIVKGAVILMWFGVSLESGFADQSENQKEGPGWHYGAYLDVAYLLDFNFPQNNLWRNKTTTTRVNELVPNLGLGYIRKQSTPHSPWGMELALQGGDDTDGLVPGPLPGSVGQIGGAPNLRYFSRANVSYFASIGNGVTLTGGLFDSYIGRESFYAKDNFNYTRSYIADQSPYFLFGVKATSPITDKVDLGLFIINGFNYLAEPNDAPSFGAQIIWNPTSRLTATQNLYYGSDQETNSLQFWRFFTDNSLEWNNGPVTLALSYDFGTQKSATAAGQPRFIWMGAAFVASWHIQGPWSVALRPEFFWDPNGLIEGAEQLLQAITTTVEYKFKVDPTQTTIFRLEYRFDSSTGSGGGFFKGGEVSPGVIGLTPSQQLLILGLMMSFDSN